MVPTQSINEKWIIIVDLKFYSNVKTEFIQSIILKYFSPWHDMCDMTCIAINLRHMCSIFSPFLNLVSWQMYFWYLYFSLQYQFDPLSLFAWEVAVSKLWAFLLFLIPSELYLSLLLPKISLYMSLYSNINLKNLKYSCLFRKYLRHKN